MMRIRVVNALKYFIQWFKILAEIKVSDWVLLFTLLAIAVLLRG